MRLGPTLAFLTGMQLFGQAPPQIDVDEAARAFGQGEVAQAQRELVAVLNKHPTDLRALLLMCAVLDSQQHYSEAEPFYQRALKIAPGSAQVLNNVANHYLSSGRPDQAREYYLKALAAEPQHPNANLQLARISVEAKRGADALGYLKRVASDGSDEPGVLELRARALGLTGQCAQAGEIVKRLQERPDVDWRIHFSAGAVYAECKEYEQAEVSFSQALDADPKNFNILYNLGLAALHAGHTERAAGVFEIALNEHPDDPDCLFALSQSYARQQRTVEAAALLSKAERLAPQRNEILLLLAQISAQLEFYQDAADTYERYLLLKPGDAEARRERAFALANSGQATRALPELDAYARSHPSVARGFFELAVAQSFQDHGKAIRSLDRALALDPGLQHAYYTRAMLYVEDGKPAAAVEDLRLLSEREPGNYNVLARLGEAYLALDRIKDAAQVLKRAAELAPDAPSVLVPYIRALQKVGDQTAAAAALSRLKQSGAPKSTARAGLLEYLRLPPAEQRQRYLENLRKSAASNPQDFRLQIRLGEELFADGKNNDALQVFHDIKLAASDLEVLGRCGSVLLQFQQYDLALQFLEPAAAATSVPAGVRLDLATVLFRLQGGGTALRELDRTPEPDRKGDYYLLRAQLLDSLGKVPEAADALNRGMQAAPARAGLYFQAASFLLKHHMRQEALVLLEQANRMVPDTRELLLAQWVTLFLLHREEDAEKLLAKIQARWPEWDRPYLLNGILLEIQLRSSDALRSLETAIALGADAPEAYYYQALAITHAAPNDIEGAENSIAHAIALNSGDPYIYLLAGKISTARKDYATAVSRLLQAVHLQPALIPAHYALRSAYKAIGKEDKSAAELEEIKRIGQENTNSEQSPFSVEDFLFGVRAPG